MNLLTPAQATIAKDKHRFRVICSGRRFGKTTLSVEEMKGKALSKPSKIAYVAPTYAQARDICWQMLIKELKPIIKKTNESRLELEVMTKDGDSSFITLRGWESIETLRGQQYDLIVIDEIASMRNFWSNWQEVVRPTLTDTKGEALFISTPKGFNHFYDLYNLEQKDSDYKSFHFSTYDNPFIPSEEVDKARLEMTEDRFAQEYLADFRKTEGLVYKEFKRELHLYEELPDKTFETLLGIDFGFTNPTAIIVVKKDREGNYWVEDEWYKTGQTNEQIVKKATSFRPLRVYADPEAPEKILEMANAGLNLIEVIKGKDSVANGINKVREVFKQFRIKVNKRCLNLILELETYHYPETRGERNENELPEKDGDHALDALRYILMSDHKQFSTELIEKQQMRMQRNEVKFKGSSTK